MHRLTSSIRKMTISSTKTDAVREIIANPNKYTTEFNILLRSWIKANLNSLPPTHIRIYYELLANEMPPNFMLWYFGHNNDTKFDKFNTFRKQHGDKIKATAVIQARLLRPATIDTDMSVLAAADAFRPTQGGRKKRKQTRVRTRQRRMRIKMIRTRRQKM
jgi:hypothetical protein